MAQDLADGGGGFRKDGVIARMVARGFGCEAHADRVSIAAGEERGAGCRTDGVGVEVVVTEAFVREAIEGRCCDRSAEGGWLAEADVVAHDEEDVGDFLGGLERVVGRKEDGAVWGAAGGGEKENDRWEEDPRAHDGVNRNKSLGPGPSD